jgi:broad specificity phosphatase PhoE
MKHLYYARHGESLVNVRNIFATKLGTVNDLGLTELGKQQALAAGSQASAEGLKIDLMISSPSPRALETANILARQLQYPVDAIELSELFLEIQYGSLEGTAWQAWWEAGNTYADLSKFPGSETIEVLQARANQALMYIQGLSAESVLIVSHSAFGRALRRAVRGLPYTDEFVNSDSLPHATIIKLI